MPSCTRLLPLLLLAIGVLSGGLPARDALAQWEGLEGEGWAGEPKPPGEETPEAQPPAEEGPKEPDKPAQTAPAAETAPDDVKLAFDDRKGFGMRYGNFLLGIHAFMQGDLALYEQYDLQSNGFRMRRARISLDGAHEAWFRWLVDVDLIGGLRDCYIELDAGRVEQIDLSVRAGYFKPPVTMEEFRTSSKFLTFHERASHVSGMFPGRHTGVMLEGELPASETGAPPLLRGWVALHNGRAGPTTVNVSNDWGLAFMAEATPLHDPAQKTTIQAGLSTWVAYYANNRNSWIGLSPDGTTGFFGPHTVRGLEQLHGFHVNVFRDRFALAFEYTFGIQQRKVDGANDLSPIVGTGFHLDASVMVYNPLGILERKPDFNQGVELCARFERQTLNDAHRGAASRTPASTGLGAVNALGGRMSAVTVGCNAYLTSRIRVSANAQVQWFDLEGQQRLYIVFRDNQLHTGGPRVLLLFRIQFFV